MWWGAGKLEREKPQNAPAHRGDHLRPLAHCTASTARGVIVITTAIVIAIAIAIVATGGRSSKRQRHTTGPSLAKKGESKLDSFHRIKFLQSDPKLIVYVTHHV